MPYIPNAPSVEMGLEKITLPNGQVVEVPKAFMNRLRFDASMSRAGAIAPNSARGTSFVEGSADDPATRRVGAMSTDRDILGTYLTKAKEGQYVAYAGMDAFLKKMSEVYGGQGQAVQYSKPYQEQQKLYGRYKEQEELRAETGASRKISMTASGQVMGDTGQVVRENQMSAYEPAINREERKLQSLMMGDLQQFKSLGQNSTVSNVPITVTRSSDPDVRSSMARHLQKLGELR